MSPPITVLEINNRLSPRHIKMLGEQSVTKNKAKFICAGNHMWSATINSVLSGNGCPECALIKKRRTRREKLESLLQAHNVEMIGTYPGNQSYTEFKCNRCLKTWTDRPIIVKRSGCAFCNGRKIDTDIVNKKIYQTGITLTTPFRTSGDRGTFRCSAGHDWDTIISNVLHNKSGCPKCAKYGFNPNLPAYCYILCYPKYIKFGITNDWARRLKEHTKSKGSFVRGFVKKEAIGTKALLWENNIKSTLHCGIVNSKVCSDGWTETTALDNLSQLVNDTFIEICNDAFPPIS